MANDVLHSAGLTGAKSVKAGPSRIPQAISLNFSVAKVLAIFTVAAGHWFTGTLLWIPVTFGLFVFAFSSAYFTTKLYGTRIDRGRFWRKKLERLGLRYWVILTFLAIVLALKGRTVLHWHTLVHYAALSGVLNWVHVRSQSALGAGLWFFTLLLIFYLAYPWLARLFASKWIAAPASIAAVAGAVLLEEHVKVGHELWLTSLGFVLGVAYGSHEPVLRAWLAAMLALAGCVSLVALNALFHYKAANTALIALTSIGIAVWLAKARLPQWAVMKKIAHGEACLLEIYLIHTYLFVHLTGSSAGDFAVSIGLIVISAAALNHVATSLTRLVFERPAPLAIDSVAIEDPINEHGLAN